MTLMKKYMKLLGDPHDVGRDFSINRLDFQLRTTIGKDYKTPESICCHDAILARELGERFCRRCHKELKTGVGRYNDYLILRNEKCPAPICLKCAKNNPDSFHLIFKEGTKKVFGD